MKFIVKEIDDIVLTAIHKQAEVILKTQKLNKLSAKRGGEQKLFDYEKRILECEEKRQRIYERFILREIDRAEYLKFKTECADEIDKLNNQLAILKQSERNKMVNAKLVEIAKEVKSKSEISREMVEALIEKVLVFPDKRVEIVWKIADFIPQNKL
jgi:hypothetical protein